MKREVNCILITILLAAILILSGCGKACPVTCNDNNTCTADSCGKETGYLCANTPIASCHIGNGRCEPDLNETKCNAPADCGLCTDQALNVTSKYLQAACDKGNACAMDVKRDLVTEVPFTTTLSFDAAQAQFNMKIEQPFDVDKSLITFDTELINMPAYMADLTVSQIQVVATINQKVVVLGETKVDKPLFDVGSKISDTVRVNYEFNEQEIQLSDVKVNVNYAFTRKTEGVADEVVTGSATYSISSPLVFINPTRKVTCKDISCDDQNSATLDICKEDRGTAYCTHERLLKVCGNYRCEPESTENKCTCPQDCGKCSRNYGNYLEFKCSTDNQCLSDIRTSTLVKTFANEKSTNYFTINVENSMNQPFKVNSLVPQKSDKFKFTVRLMDTKADLVTAPKFTMVEIYGLNQELLGKAVFDSNNQLGGINSYVTFELPLSFIMSKLEEQRTINPKIYYEYAYREQYFDTVTNSYKYRTATARDSYQYQITGIDFVNPDQ